jgi:hypothetical protein
MSMAIDLTKPNIGSTNWGDDVNTNWQTIKDAINGAAPSGLIRAGLIADRPAASSANAATLYFATDYDSGTLYRSDGSSWTKLASASAGGTSDHSALSNLSYASAGHTGFEPSTPRSAKVTSTSTNLTLDSTHNVVLCTNTSDITITLPAASGCTDRAYYIKKTGASSTYANSRKVTVDGNGSETIDGATTVILEVQYDAIRIVSDGSNWNIIGDERRPHVARMIKTNTQSITTGGWRQVQIDSLDFDNSGLVDTGNYRIVIRRSGKYRITGSCGATSNLSAVYTAIYVNGSVVQIGWSVQAAANAILTAEAVITMALAASDVITLYTLFSATQNNGTDEAHRPKLIVEEILPY